VTAGRAVVAPWRAVALRPCRAAWHYAPFGIRRRQASRAFWHPAPFCPAPFRRCAPPALRRYCLRRSCRRRRRMP